MLTVDINCDMGESFGAWRMGNDAELMDHVSSVNIACGFHAGDPSTIRRTIEIGLKKDVAIGAHPSFPDLQGFGRRDMAMSPAEIHDVVLYQIAAVKGVIEALGGRMHHVKPHGALYNKAAKNPEISAAIAEAVLILDPSLVLVGLSGSLSVTEAESLGLKTASEVFADRTYQADGSLTPRTHSYALVTDVDLAATRVLGMVREQKVIALTGEQIDIKAETICIHGDSPYAVEFAKRIRSELDSNGIRVAPVEPRNK